jgi:cytochrome c biogenesis protein CcmG/thiol:disulfide interchange protein DsbE
MSKLKSKRAEIRRRNQHKTPAWPFLVGIGLLVIAFILIPSDKSAPSSTEGLSSVPAEVNYPAPELSLENLNGGTESLVDYRDKVTLVNNWATWCPPCKAELPTLVAYYEDHADEGFIIIGIEAGEPASEVKTFANQFQISYPVWLDPKNLAGRAFANSSLPNSYVIDRAGMIRLAWTGQISLEMLEKYVTPLIAEE